MNHSVTQSSFATPCTTFDAGIDSDFFPIPPDTTSFPQFSLTVTSSPLWFYCRQKGHCGVGMVFAVNPPANESFEAFQTNAIATANNHISNTSATIFNTLPAVSSSSEATSIVTIRSGTTGVPLPTTKAEVSDKLIIGATIGGLAVVGAIFLAFFCFWRRKGGFVQATSDFSIINSPSKLQPFTLTLSSPTTRVIDWPIHKYQVSPTTTANLTNIPLPVIKQPRSTLLIATERTDHSQPLSPFAENSPGLGTTQPAATFPIEFSPLSPSELTSEQMVTLRTLHSLEVPAADITAVMERMRVGQVDSTTSGDLVEKRPPSYDAIGI